MDDKLYIKKFIRDDGEKLSFDGEQLYLAQENTLLVRPDPSTTAVNFTEADGGEMISQQNTTYDQPVNGLIIPKSTDYWTLTKQLSLFFKVKHTYKIIYVKKDGSMFKVSNAWISSGLQIVPVSHEEYSEWSVTMTIGNVNWTEYAEDSQGKEIYSNTITLPLISAATGGEEWEYEEQEEISGEGSEITFNDTVDGAKITDLTLKGDTYQQTYSGKNLIDNNNTAYDYSNVGSQYNTVTTLPTGLRYATTYPNGVPVVGFKLVELTPYKGKVVRLKSTFGDKGRIRILTGASDASDRSVEVTTSTSGEVISYTVPNDLGSRNYLFFDIGVVDATGNNTVDYTDLILTIDNADMTYEPYVGGTASPNPDYPQDVQVVTGEQTVSISDGNRNTQSYTVDLGSIELCKIGDYQDYIYKSGDDWYIHKDTDKVVLDGTESWDKLSGPAYNTYYVDGLITALRTNSTKPYLSNNFTPITNDERYRDQTFFINSNNRILMSYDAITSTGDWETWLGSNNTSVYYALATPTDTKITDNTLIEELEALYAAQGYNGKTIITVSATSTDLPTILAVTLQNPPVTGEVWDEVGTIWELGSGGTQTVNIDSTTTVYPVWVVEGPCVNPTLQNNTTDTIAQYDSTIAAGQTLTVNFEEGTAYLDSALVTRYVSGLVSLRPGENTIGFNSDGGDTETSTISWNNVIN